MWEKGERENVRERYKGKCERKIRGKMWEKGERENVRERGNVQLGIFVYLRQNKPRR
jgi:hypothetical protein